MKKSNNKSARQAKLQTKQRVQEQKLKRDGVHYKGQLISREKYNAIIKRKMGIAASHRRQRSMFNHASYMPHEMDFLGELVDRISPTLPYGMGNYTVDRAKANLAATFTILDSIHTGIIVSKNLIKGER